MEDYIQKIKEKIEAYLKSPKENPYYGNLFKDTLLIIKYYEQQENS